MSGENSLKRSWPVRTKWGYWTLALVALLLCGAARAQDRQGTQASSELSQRNMGLVAASAAEIKAVLSADPGLMVTLKSWVAQDATDHGQIISESDLTDDAIYDRLEADTSFRSVATKLLQRYGYLVPKVNPDSELGEEQALLIQERAKWVAQDEEQELAAARKNASQNAQNAGSHNGPAVPERIQTEPMQPGFASPAEPGQPEPTAPNVPSNRQSGIEQAQLSQQNGQLGSLSPSLFSDPGNSGQLGGDLTANPFGPLTPQPISASPGDQLSALFASSGAADNLPGSQSAQTGSRGAYSRMPAPRAFAGGGSASFYPTVYPAASSQTESRPRYQNGTLEQPVELARTSDPYSGIPSLYDMYLQANPRPQKPTRFGINVFNSDQQDEQLIPMDLPAGPDYVVGPGDGLAIDLWGGVSQRMYRTVDREGRVSLPEVGPVLVSGKSLADVQQSLQRVLRSQFRDVSVDVSLSRLRTVRVYVVGDVVNPGAYDISSLSTPLNALFAAGGPTPRGSLRIVKHYRGSQLVQEVDLYDLLLHGVKSDLARLENGDTVLVPPIGSQVTVEGMVRRPAIYELKDEKNLASVLDLAGGLLPTAALQHIEVQRTVAHQKETMISLDVQSGDSDSEIEQKLASFPVHDGDDVRIFPIAPYNRSAVYLEGHVVRPGRYSYHAGMRLTDLIDSYKDLLPEPATQYAEIIRLNAPDFRPSVEGFNLGEALENPSKAPVLHAMDTVRIFGKFDFENPPTVSVLGDVRTPGTFHTDGQIRLSDAVHLAGGLAPDAQTGDAQVFRYLADGKLKIFSIDLSEALAGDPAQNILLTSRDRVLIHRSPDAVQPATVYIRGEVGEPGRYPLTSNMKVADLIRAAGGLTPSADKHLGDLTRYQWENGNKLNGEHGPVEIAAALKGDPAADVGLHNGDVVTIRQLPGWNDLGASITVSGEVKHPGTYGIRPGERLSSILERAGGLRGDAYAYGAILQRTDVRKLETKQQDELILRVRDAEQNLATMPTTTQQEIRAKNAALAQYQVTLTQLATNPPVGRVTIRISSNIKRWRGTVADVAVRAGDRLFIPKRPSYVMVTGQVFNGTAVSYRPGKSAKWYLSQAGGPTTMANRRNIFVIRADGSVIGKSWSLWGGSSLNASLMPGDTVVVPEKALGGGPNWQSLFTSAQMASSVATTVVLALHY